VRKERKDWRVRVAALALLFSIGWGSGGAALQQGGAISSTPRWDDRIAGVEIWRIPTLPATGRMIRENDIQGRPLRCAAAARIDDPNDPRLTAIEFGIEIEPESPSDDEPDTREPRDRAKIYLRVRLADRRTGAPIEAARPIWHLHRPLPGAEWTFLPMDGEGFERAEARLAGASDRTNGDAGADVAGQTALVSLELPSDRPVRIVATRGAGFTMEKHWELSRCVCDIDDSYLRYIGCRNVGWR
jgi:hypothetical protein